MLGEPWMMAVGVSLSEQICPEFQAFDYTHDRRTYWPSPNPASAASQ